MNDKLHQPIHEEDSSLTQEEDLFFPTEEEDLFLPVEEEDLPSRAEALPFSPPEPKVSPARGVDGLHRKVAAMR